MPSFRHYHCHCHRHCLHHKKHHSSSSQNTIATKHHSFDHDKNVPIVIAIVVAVAFAVTMAIIIVIAIAIAIAVAVAIAIVFATAFSIVFAINIVKAMPMLMPEDSDVDKEGCVGGEENSSCGHDQQLLCQCYRSLCGFVSGPNMIVMEEDVDQLIYLRGYSKISESYKEYKKICDGGRGCFALSKLADAIEHVRGLLMVGNVMSIWFIIIARDTPVKPYDLHIGGGAVVHRRKAKL